MNELFVEFKPKMGRPRYYSPKEVIVQFEKYLEARKAASITMGEKNSVSYSNGNTSSSEKIESHPHPLSIGDFCNFLGVSRHWWNELPEDFLEVKSYIANYLETFQLKGAMVGLFNANIVSRLLGLADKKEFVADGVKIVVNSQEEKGKIDNIGGLGI